MHWVTCLEGGPCRVNHAAAGYGNLVFSFGGYCKQDDPEIRRPIDVYVLNTETNRWRPIAPPEPGTEQYLECPYQRYGHTAVTYGKYAYIWGGRNDSDGASNVLHQFDMTTFKWKIVGNDSDIIPAARDGHSACVIGTLMVVFGGFEDDFQRFSQETFAFDFATDRWSELRTKGPPPAWRDFHTATAIGNVMYVFGGRSDALGQFHSNREVYHDRLMYLNLNDLTWYSPQTSGSAPSGRRSHTAWEYMDKLYMFGGYCGTNNQHFDTLHEYNPGTKAWRQCHVIGMGPSARRRHVTVLVNNRVYLFGGTCPMPSDRRQSPQLNGPLHHSLVGDRGLMDLTDLYILDYNASLFTLSAMAVINQNLHKTQTKMLPWDVRVEIQSIVEENKISPCALIPDRAPVQG